MGMSARVAVVTSDWSRTLEDPDGAPVPGGSGFYRAAQPGEALARYGGRDVTVGALLADPSRPGVFGVSFPGTGRDALWGFDVVVIHRVLDMRLPALVLAARAQGVRVIVDLDDAYDALATSNLAWVGTHPYPALAEAGIGRTERRRREGLARAQAAPQIQSRDALYPTCAVADLVTVSTGPLADRVRARTGGRVPVEVIPNAVDVDWWQTYPTGAVRDDHAATVALSRCPSPAGPTVGWVGATGFRSGDLETLRGIIGPWASRHEAVWHHGGAHPDLPLASEAVGLPADVVALSAPMCAYSTYPALWAPLDIAVIPLAPHAFNLSKSNIKALEAAAAGVPFVASQVGPYVDLPFGRTAKNAREWRRHLDELLDPAARNADRARNADAVRAYDIATAWSAWEAWLG